MFEVGYGESYYNTTLLTIISSSTMETTELNMLQSGIIRFVPAGCVGPDLLRLKVLAVVKELNMRFGARNKS